MRTILILAANPRDTTQLRLDQEVRDIEEALERAEHRDQFVLKSKLAVRPRDIQRAMLDIKPSIVHFSGHGAGDEGLVFEDNAGLVKQVDGEALAGLFELFADQVECVVLNGCYSEVQAKAIAEHINYVIGMKKAIGDKAAIEFAVGFYDALGAGEPVKFAYKFGCAAIRLARIPEQLTPILKEGVKNQGAFEKKYDLENLTSEQRKELRAALISAFPNSQNLALMVEDELDLSLNLITQGEANYEISMAKLVQWAEAQGKLQQLLEGASRANPGNPKLKKLVSLWLKM